MTRHSFVRGALKSAQMVCAVRLGCLLRFGWAGGRRAGVHSNTRTAEATAIGAGSSSKCLARHAASDESQRCQVLRVSIRKDDTDRQFLLAFDGTDAVVVSHGAASCASMVHEALLRSGCRLDHCLLSQSRRWHGVCVGAATASCDVDFMLTCQGSGLGFSSALTIRATCWYLHS
eukprot:4282469-Amphidinium_carterae.2